MKYLMLTVVLLMYTFCIAGQLENLQKPKNFGGVSVDGKVSISEDNSSLIFKYKDYSYTFNISKQEGLDFRYFEYRKGKSLGLLPVNDWYAMVSERQNIAFFIRGKRVARIDMNNNTIQTIAFPYEYGMNYRYDKKSFIDNKVAYFLAEPDEGDDGPKKVDLFEVNFKSEEVKNIFSLPVENEDQFDIALKDDMIFTFDIIHGIRIYDLKTGAKIREIDCSDVFPPIVLKDIDSVRRTSLILVWDGLSISFKGNRSLWEFNFTYDIHAGTVTETSYKHKDFAESDLKPIWVGDKFMFYKFVKFPESEIYIPFPKYPGFNRNAFSKKYYANYMEELYRTKYTVDSIYQANKNSNKLFGNGSHIDTDEDAIPEMYSYAEYHFFVDKDEMPKKYRSYKKERKIFGEEGKAEMDSLMPILEREYGRMIKHNLDKLDMIENAGGELKIYADIAGNQEVYSFEYATKARGVYGQENQVEITKVDEFGEYEIIFDLKTKEIVSTNRKTDF